MTVLLIAVGAAIGGLIRWWLDQRLPAHRRIPLSTLIVNVSGSLLLGVVVSLENPDLRALLGAGLCGGLTTFSTLGLQWEVALRERRVRDFVAYLLLTLTLGLCAAWAGLHAGLHFRT